MAYKVKPFKGKVTKKNYFIDGQIILLEQGKTVDEKIVNKMTSKAKEILFDKVTESKKVKDSKKQ